MRRNLIVLGVIVLVVTFMLWTGIRKSRNSGVAGAPLKGEVKGSRAPEFSLKDLDGKTVRLSDFKGKAVLLNFWATWCSPCKAEIPWFVDLQEKYGPQGLRVVGIAMDDAGRDAIYNFTQKMGINYTILLGSNSVADLYGGVDALPTTFYIGRDGRVVSRVFGLASHSTVEDNIKAALSQRGARTAEDAPVVSVEQGQKY